MEPDQEISMGVIATAVGLIGVVLGWGAKVYNAGKRDEATLARITATEKDVAALRSELDDRTAKVHRALKDDREQFTAALAKFEKSVDKLYSLVYNDDGAVKFITHPEHSKMSDECKSSFRRDLDYIILNNRKDIEHLVANNNVELTHIHSAIRRIEEAVANRQPKE